MESLKIEIKNIRYGKKPDREHTLYAQLFVNDELSIVATLDYIVKRIPEIISKEGE